MKIFKNLLFIAVGLLLSISVAHSQDTPDEKPEPVESLSKNLHAKPLALNVVVNQEFQVFLDFSNIAITTYQSTALAYVPELHTYASKNAKYCNLFVTYKISKRHIDSVNQILKIPLQNC